MQVGGKLIKIALTIFLGICAVFDIRKNEIPIIMLVIGIISALGLNLWQISAGNISIADAGGALVPGLFFLFISFYTKEKVGYGDGLILLIAGLALGFYQCFFGLCLSLVFSAAMSILLLLMHKAEKNSGFPFVPFLAIGMGVSFFV